MIIKLAQFQDALWPVWPHAQFPAIRRCVRLWVFDRSWFAKTFLPFLAEMLEARGVRYLPGSGMCEVFANLAVWEANLSVLKLADQEDAPELGGDPDVTAALFEARVVIPKGRTLNGIGPGAHATCLVVLREKDGSFGTWFFEPQMAAKGFGYACCKIGDGAGVDLHDCIV